MVYKKTNSSSRPGYKRCGKMVYSDAKKALAIARGVKRLLNVEVKNFDVQSTSANLNQTPSIIQLSNIPQGGTTITRDGAQCKMVGLNIHYTIIASATSPRTVCRIMFVLDRQTNQAIYTIGDLLEDSTANDNIVSPFNLDNKHRFQVLYDRIHMLSVSVPTVTVKKYIRKDLLLRYDNSTPSIADLTQNSLSMVRFANEATNLPEITMFIRLRFVDN